MEIKKISWLDGFHETCQDIIEDAILLEALAVYTAAGGPFLRGDTAAYFSPTFRRLTSYLSQHVLELYRLEDRLEPER